MRGCQMKESGADQWKLVIPLPFPAFVLAVRELLSIRVVPNVCNNPIPRPLKACMLPPVGNRGCWLCNRPAPFIIDK